MLERLADPGLMRPFAARANVLLPGVYAWGTTVAASVTAARAPGLARVTALVALVALVLGPLVAPKRALLGRVLGIHAFLALCVATWALLTRAGITLGGDPIHATFGAIGWVLYAFGWGELRGPGSVPEDDPRVLPGPVLPARSALSRSVSWVLTLGPLGALLLVFLAFRVERPAHAVLAHALALVVGLFLIGAATRVALDRTPRAVPSETERLGLAAGSLTGLLVVLGLGALFLLLVR